MVGRTVIHYVCTLVVLLVHLHAGTSDVFTGGARGEQAPQASKDVIMREDAEEVFYITGLKENSRRNNGNQAAARTETREALTEIRSRHLEDNILQSRHLEDNILQSPPSYHPGHQHLVKTRRNQYRAVEAELPGDYTSQLPSICLHRPDGRVCGVAFKRYYFDPATRECHKFIYGGCQDSSNNFETLKSCNMACLGHE